MPQARTIKQILKEVGHFPFKIQAIEARASGAAWPNGATITILGNYDGGFRTKEDNPNILGKKKYKNYEPRKVNDSKRWILVEVLPQEKPKLLEIYGK